MDSHAKKLSTLEITSRFHHIHVANSVKKLCVDENITMADQITLTHLHTKAFELEIVRLPSHSLFPCSMLFLARSINIRPQPFYQMLGEGLDALLHGLSSFHFESI